MISNYIKNIVQEYRICWYETVIINIYSRITWSMNKFIKQIIPSPQWNIFCQSVDRHNLKSKIVFESNLMSHLLVPWVLLAIKRTLSTQLYW